MALSCPSSGHRDASAVPGPDAPIWALLSPECRTIDTPLSNFDTPCRLPSGRWLDGWDASTGTAVSAVPERPRWTSFALEVQVGRALEVLREARDELGATRLVLVVPDLPSVRLMVVAARAAGLTVEVRHA